MATFEDKTVDGFVRVDGAVFLFDLNYGYNTGSHEDIAGLENITLDGHVNSLTITDEHGLAVRENTALLRAVAENVFDLSIYVTDRGDNNGDVDTVNEGVGLYCAYEVIRDQRYRMEMEAEARAEQDTRMAEATR